MALKKQNAVEEIKTEEVVTEAVTEEVMTEAVDKVEPEVEKEEVVETETEVTESADVLEEDEPEAEVKANPTPEASTSTAVSTGAGKAPATSSNNPSAMKSLEKEGFQGLELDFSSFVGIVLDKGEFVCTDGTIIEKEGFTLQIQSTKDKYCFRSEHPNDKDVEVAYSYDINAPSDPESLVAKSIKNWKDEDDVGYSVKKYLEVYGLVLDGGTEDGALDGQLVVLSISPTSIGRLSGFLFQQKLKDKMPNQFVTRVFRGPKVDKGDFPYYPWGFRVED